MEFNEYQRKAHETAVYPTKHSLEYLVLGLCGECGEAANKIKKILRGDILPCDLPEAKQAILAEIGDILWYAAELTSKLGGDLSLVAARNLQKLADRKKRMVIRGEGDSR